MIVAMQPPALVAAAAATKNIPIVMRSTSDPVQVGFVESLGQPGGNVTGVTSYSGNLYGKRLELLKELVPGLSRVAVLSNPGSGACRGCLEETRLGAGRLGLKLLLLQARNAQELSAAFAEARRAKAQAIIPLRDPLVVGARLQIAELAIKNRLPAIYDDRVFVEAGGLLSYGASVMELHRRMAYFVDRILRGSKPFELPVEGPSRFEMVVNAKAARSIKLELPRSIVLLANEVLD
jgi:putative ABC transport system substrate-binding protein